jgi:hypothetical protein
MSNKMTAILGGMLLVVAFLAGTTQGCGSSSGGDNYVDLCNRGCEKFGACNADAGVPVAGIVQQCKSNCTSMGQQTGTCSNQTQIVNAFKVCLDVSCEALDGCLEGIPACVGGSGGSGGSTGAAGSTGQGGAGGGGAADCSVCAKANSCCLALGGTAADCMSFSASMCSSTPAADQATFIQVCQAIVTAAASSGNPPAACR